MGALEQEIYEKFERLDDDAKERVLQHLTTKTKPFNWNEWFQQIESINAQMHAETGSPVRIDVVGLLREVREKEA